MKNAEGRWQAGDVERPNPIGEYNRHMGGVDKSDQLIVTYSCLMKCHRWWKTLFFHMLDVSIINSYILFSQFCQQHLDNPELRRKANYTPLQFREELCKQLGGISDDDFVPVPEREHRGPRPARDFMVDHMLERTPEKRNCRVCYISDKTENKSYYRCRGVACREMAGVNGLYLCMNSSRNCHDVWHSAAWNDKRK